MDINEYRGHDRPGATPAGPRRVDRRRRPAGPPRPRELAQPPRPGAHRAGPASGRRRSARAGASRSSASPAARLARRPSSPARRPRTARPVLCRYFRLFAQNEFLYALIFLTRSEVRTVPVGAIIELIRRDVFYWGQLMAAALLGPVPVARIYSSFGDYYAAGLTARPVTRCPVLRRRPRRPAT